MKSVSIVGSAPSSQHLAPYGQEAVWVLGSQAHYHAERGQEFTRIFEIHNTFDWAQHKDHAQAIAGLGAPLVVNEGFPLKGKNIDVFNHKKASMLLECGGRAYLTSSIAYMIAQAVMDGYEKISIYGVDLTVHDAEYFHQRTCTEAWIGLAKGKGIEVFIPPQSSLMKATFVYGIDENGIEDTPFSEAKFILLAGKHEAVIADIDSQIDELMAKRRAHEGSYSTLMKLSNIARGLRGGAVIKDINDVLLVRDA